MVILVGALLVEPYVRPVEGFQAQESLPTDIRTVRGIVIKAPLKDVAAKLPFIHSNFESVKTVDLATNPPTTSGDEKLTIPQYMSDTTPGLYYFKLKQPVNLVLTQEMIDMLKTASTNLLGGENLIGFWVTPQGALNGTTFPKVMPPAPPILAAIPAAIPAATPAV